MKRETRRVPFVWLLCAALLVTAGAFAEDDRAGIAIPVDPGQVLANVTVYSSQIVFDPVITYENAVLTLSGPDEYYRRLDYPASASLVLSISDARLGDLADGLYNFELVFTPVVDEATRKTMQASRDNDDPSLVTDLKRRGKLPSEALKTSSSFRVAGGQIIDPDASEVPLTTKDIVHLDDVIASFSLCVGNDCVNGESFGFDTLRLKENNVRVHFDDTSTSASFPRNDWRLIANDSSNGGNSYFAIEDSTAGRQVFVVEAGASTSAIYVDTGNDVGFGNSNPVVNLHVTDGNTPTLRLEQNGSSGFTPQTWDLAGNEANFFLRDATNGSQLVFRVKPGAPTDSIFVASDGDVGLGTDSPQEMLDITNGNILLSNNMALLAERTDSTKHQILTLDGNDDLIFNRGSLIDGYPAHLVFGIGASKRFDVRDSTNTTVFRVMGASGRVAVGNFYPSHPLEMTSGAHVTAGGVWTNASSREYKTDIQSLEAADAVEALAGMEPVTFRYKNEASHQYVGFIAEDVPDLVSTADRKGLSPMDVVAVLTAVVKEQRVTIEQQNQAIEDLKQRFSELEKRLGTAVH